MPGYHRALICPNLFISPSPPFQYIARHSHPENSLIHISPAGSESFLDCAALVEHM